MKRLSFLSLSSPPVLAEFGSTSLKILDGTAGLELSLERSDNGRLTPACVEQLQQGLQVFFRNRVGSRGRSVLCAIGARGVSLRRLILPHAPKDELEQLVPLQIEREFPLPPDELAWGYVPVRSGNGVNPAKGAGPDNGHANGKTEILIAAVKRDLIQQYADVLSAVGLTPTFTIAAFQRRLACPATATDFAVLDLGRTTTELITFQHGLPAIIRCLPFGGENITALSAELANLSAAIPNESMGPTLYLTGPAAGLEGLPEELVRRLGTGTKCQRVALERGEGHSAALTGLQRYFAEGGREPQFILQMPSMTALPTGQRRAASWQWAALAAVLAVVCLGLRYVEPVLGQNSLNRQMATLRQRKADLPQVDRELSFLQHLRTNQPPYLELVHSFAAAAPPGTRFDSISLSRRGDLSLRASMGGSEQVSGFRSKLIGSGLFASVTVDEQTPSPDRQKVTVRITGQRGESTAIARAPGAGDSAPRPKPPESTAPTSSPAATVLAEHSNTSGAAAATNVVASPPR